MRKLRMTAIVITVSAAALILQTLVAGAAQATIYQKTVIGMDFHALDYRQSVQFLPDTGGGAYLVGDAPGESVHYMETSVDLPAGAKIKNVTIFYKDCFPGDEPNATWYFGAYNPSGGFDYLAPTKSVKACAFSSLQLIPTGDVRVLGSRRYTIGMATDSSRTGTSTLPELVVRGARVSYTCPVKCLP